MQHSSSSFELIENQAQLEHFCTENRSSEWLAIDTEFVGEKRFHTRLCLIQAATPKGNYIIDPFGIERFDPFLDLIEDPAILKITHAGENEYRILYQQYDAVPQNVFDTQLAAAFLGYKHPVSFRRLAENELGLKLDKTLTTADWEARPLNRKYLRYAMDDVIPLYPLMEQMKEKLIRHDRLEWALEECKTLESEEYYIKDPNSEALGSSMMKSLNMKEKIFLLRLYQWRREQAEAKNHSKEMVLPAKLIAPIVRGVGSGLEGLRNNRRLPEHIIRQHGRLFTELFNAPGTAGEKALIASIEVEEDEDPMEEILQEILYLLIRYKCLETGITPAFVMTKSSLRKLKNGIEEVPEELRNGWRRRLLGEDIYHWMANYDRLELAVEAGKIELRVR